MPKPSADAAADRTSLCNRAGFCVHGSVGVLVRVMHGQFGNSITNVRFRREFVADRKLLETSGIVICAIALQPPAGVPGCLGPHELVNIWLHIGVMEFVPKQLEGHVLRQRDVKASQLDSVSVCCREVQLVGCWAFESMWTFVRYLDKNLVWSMRFFRFSSSPRPIGRLRSINCDVVELSPLAGGLASSCRLALWGLGGGDRLLPFCPFLLLSFAFSFSLAVWPFRSLLFSPPAFRLMLGRACLRWSAAPPVSWRWRIE